MKKFALLAALLVGLLVGATAAAQQPEEPAEDPAPEPVAPTEGEGAEDQEPLTEEEKAEAERLAKEKAEAEQKAKEEAERLAKEEAERLAKEKAEAEQKAKEAADQARLTDEDLKPLKEIDTEVLEKVTIRKSYPYIEHHGMFRFRADSFINLDLNTTGTSPILPPPESFPVDEQNAASAPDPQADAYVGANIRFRYAPTIHLYEDLQIKIELDVPDNLVLGSLPDGGRTSDRDPLRPDVPKLAFSGGQIPPDEGVKIKQAYGQVRTFFGVLRLGRMSSHWGLGILANGGQCMDCDFGDAADRAMFITRLPVFESQGLYVAASYDFPNEGIVDFDNNQFLGQNRDLSQIDDVNQYALAIFKAPVQEEEKAAQASKLRDRGEPVLNGGAYLVYRSQEASFENFVIDQSYPNIGDLPVLEARGAEAIIPDLWVQFLWEPQYRKRLRLELEAVAILGGIDFVAEPGEGSTECFSDPNAAACQAKQRDVKQLGLAFEGEFRFNDFATVGLNSGFATGRNKFGFQINDGKVDPEGTPSNFKFDRDYHVDMILFREIIGSVTNATYFNPWVQFDFWTRNQDTFGFRFDTIYSQAHKAAATPSGERSLGLEFDGQLFYHEEEKFRADLSYGLLIPLAAFDEKVGRTRLTYPGFDSPTILPEDLEGRSGEAEPAQSIQARLFWFF